MLKHLIITLLLLLACTPSLHAQNTYNFDRGVEEFNNGHYEAAMQLFAKELQRNDEDPGSWFYIAAIYDRNDFLGAALTAVNNCIKYAAPKQHETLAMAHHLRSTLYRQLGDSAAELSDLDQAVRHTPKSADFLRFRGDYFYEHEDYDRSDDDFNKILSIEKDNAYAMIALARNAEARKQYDKSVEWCTRALRADPEMSAAAHMFRSDGYMGMKDYDNAAADLIAAIDNGGGRQIIDRINTLADTAFTPLATRLQEKVVTDPENENWLYALGMVAIHSGHPAEALPQLEKAAHGGDDSFINGMLARCLCDVGDLDRAISVKRLSIERDSTTATDTYGLAGMLKLAELNDEAMEAINHYIDREPDDGDAYTLRADIHRQAGRIEQAIDDYTAAIVLLEPDDDSAHDRYFRGVLLDAQGQQAAARDDWQYIADNYATQRVAALANQRLGHTDQALQIIDSLMNKNESNADRRRTLWTAASLNALLHNHQQAIHLLRQACQCGFIAPALLRHDPDLAGLHGNPDFEQIIESQKHPHENTTTTH